MGATYNATADVLERNLTRAERPAFRQDGRVTTYGALCERANRAGNALRALGVQMEQRVLLCMLDTPDLPAVFWGAMREFVMNKSGGQHAGAFAARHEKSEARRE